MKPIYTVLIILVVVAAGLLAFNLMNRPQMAAPQLGLSSITPALSVQTAPQPAPTASTVVIQGMSFMPVTLTVPSGTTVTWVNQDSVSHTVTSDSGSTPGLASQVLGPGESYSVTLTTIGTYNYHCSIHPSMTGQVIVQ